MMVSWKKLFLFGLFLLMVSQTSLWAMASRPPKTPIMPETKTEQPKQILTLEESYRRALNRSETIAIHREEIAKARADWLKASGTAIGDGDFVITDFFQDKQPVVESAGGSSFSSTYTAAERRERKFTVSQPIFQGFKTLGALTGAGSVTKQRKEEHKRSKEVLFMEVVQAFYGLLREQKNVETIEGIHALFEERIGDLKEREAVGRSRTSEVATAQSKMKMLEAQLAQAKGTLEIAKSLMEFYTGIPSDDSEYVENPLPEKEVQAPEDFEVLAKRRHDVEALRQAMKTAKQAIVVAQSDLWPKITLDGNQYEMREGFQSGTSWDVLLKVNVPLFRGGDTLGKIKSAYSVWKQAKLQYSLAKRQAILEIKEAYQNWHSAQEQDKAFQQAVKASEENYRFQKEDYSRSLVNNLDVLSALEELFSTSQDANKVHYQKQENYWNYETAIGECCEDFLSPSTGSGSGVQKLS